jgi:hypothetical protein
MGLRFISALVTVLCAAATGCAPGHRDDRAPDPSPDVRQVVLSYEVRIPRCLGCPEYRVEFAGSGVARFHGLRWCAVPGEQVVPARADVFAGLKAAFDDAHFFDLARTDEKRWAVDAGIVTLRYRDGQRSHETLDAGGRRRELTAIEDRFGQAAKIVTDDFVNPSLPVYERLVKAGWDVNAVGEDGENALTTVATDHRTAAFLLQHGATVSKIALWRCAAGKDAELFRALAAARRLRVRSDEGRELVIQAAQWSTPVLQALLSMGADANARTADHGTALDAAASRDSRERVRILLAKGADPRLAERGNQTLIRDAARK